MELCCCACAHWFWGVVTCCAGGKQNLWNSCWMFSRRCPFAVSRISSLWPIPLHLVHLHVQSQLPNPDNCHIWGFSKLSPYPILNGRYQHSHSKLRFVDTVSSLFSDNIRDITFILHLPLSILATCLNKDLLALVSE